MNKAMLEKIEAMRIEYDSACFSRSPGGHFIAGVAFGLQLSRDELVRPLREALELLASKQFVTIEPRSCISVISPYGDMTFDTTAVDALHDLEEKLK